MPSAKEIRGLERSMSDDVCHQMKRRVQQMTALHRIASSKNAFEISFSRAKVRLFPSTRTRVSKVVKKVCT